MFKRVLPTVVAAMAGLLILLGYFVPIGFLGTMRIVLVQWATVLAAFALLLAYLNILRVHVGRLFRKRAPNRVASMILVLASIMVLVLVILQGSDGEFVQAWLSMVLIPGQSALLALTAITLTLAGTRLLRTRRNGYTVIFLLGALITLMAAIPIVYPPMVGVVMGFVDAVAMGGVRGLLLGVVLGIVLTGLRIILGIDRPHSGE